MDVGAIEALRHATDEASSSVTDMLEKIIQKYCKRYDITVPQQGLLLDEPVQE